MAHFKWVGEGGSGQRDSFWGLFAPMPCFILKPIQSACVPPLQTLYMNSLSLADRTPHGGHDLTAQVVSVRAAHFLRSPLTQQQRSLFYSLGTALKHDRSCWHDRRDGFRFGFSQHWAHSSSSLTFLDRKYSRSSSDWRELQWSLLGNKIISIDLPAFWCGSYVVAHCSVFILAKWCLWLKMIPLEVASSPTATVWCRPHIWFTQRWCWWSVLKVSFPAVTLN